MLNMSDGISMFHVTAMFATVNIQRNVPTKFVGMLMFYTTFYMSRSNGTFVLTKNTEATYRS
jgi:hypothetical protein